MSDKTILPRAETLTCNKISDFEEISAGDRKLRLYILSPTLVRFRYASSDIWQRDFSYAIAKTDHPKTDYTVEVMENEVVINTGVIVIKIKAELSVTICDENGKIVLEDNGPVILNTHYENGTTTIRSSRKIHHGEHFYGLGDKPEHPDLRNHSYTLWGTDQYGFYRHTDPLYKSIPFYIGLHAHKAYGIFYDNTFRSYFDFGKTHHHECTTTFDGGEMNYYFIYGPEMIDVTRQYTLLTGTPEFPPLWALGYQQCKWSYSPESQLYEICDTFRKNEIPCDVIYLDIDYMDGFRCFTWDNEKFPNPKKMIADLREKGFKTVVIVDPGIKIDETYNIFNEGLENKYFCRKGEGGYISGKVWPGDCYFPDFTNPEVRKWWSGLFEDLIKDKGVKGVWNDMNEPALFEVPNKSFPNDVRHNFDGEECSHKKAHNVYGMQMARATYEGVKKFTYPERPFVITRSTYCGGQRYSSAWTGDNIASWDHLWISNVMTQRLSISGFSFVGSDVGGFIDSPSPELYVRWIQLATFHPFFRTHSSGDHGDQEPWSFGEEALAIVKKFIKIRYRFLPYIYSAFYQYVKEGTPMLRPIYMFDQHDMHTHYRADEVVHGDHVLYAPMLEEGLTSRSMFFPKGIWYHYFTHKSYKGGAEHRVDVALDSAPIFIKAGAVIPHFPEMNYVGEKPVMELELRVYYTPGTEKSMLYEDAGDGYEYLNGKCNVKHFYVKGDKKSVHISQQVTGNFKPSYSTYRLKLIGFPDAISAVFADGKSVTLEDENTAIVPQHFGGVDILF
ncbi:MAG: glycoside hydrolase family 31 protein [Saprospiraceae bacterium]|nr:glycoside hydrolase family 31 protein [Saprospiraceae bacterium]